MEFDLKRQGFLLQSKDELSKNLLEVFGSGEEIYRIWQYGFCEGIEKRRTVRKFAQRPVEAEKVDKKRYWKQGVGHLRR